MDVVDVAKDAVELGPVCESCLGRTMADWSRGLTNRQRGEAALIALAIAEDVPFESIAPEDQCWVCEGLCDRYDTLAEDVVDAIGDREFSTYQVGTRLPPFIAENDRLFREDIRGDANAGESLKRECNREIGKRVGKLTEATVEFGRPDVLAIVDIEAETIEITVNSAFIYGRYRKLERGIPQTRWPCSTCDGRGIKRGEECPDCDGSGLRYQRSVEQLVAPSIQEAMDGSDATFHGAGREDIDARMLGTGRPFVVEVSEPRRRTVDLHALTEAVNTAAGGAVEVIELAMATHEMVEHVKELEASKTYEVNVSFSEHIDEETLTEAIKALEGRTIEQETPSRVSHRRAALTRTRTVYAAELLEETDSDARIKIHGEGGLYIKELLHGDDGRTTPNLADELGVTVTVDALDVVEVVAEGDRSFDTERYLH